MKRQIIDRSTVYSGYLTVERLNIKLADGTIVPRDIESHGDAAAVLPYDTGHRCAFVVRLFRAPFFNVTQEISLERACAGMIDDDVDDEAAALREAYEELGAAPVSLHGLERRADLVRPWRIDGETVLVPGILWGGGSARQGW
jgi:hypothetical protein